MAQTRISSVLLTASGNPCLFVIPEGELLIVVSGMLASQTVFEGILHVSVFSMSLRKIS